jgi:hypothetical protein
VRDYVTNVLHSYSYNCWATEDNLLLESNRSPKPELGKTFDRLYGEVLQLADRYAFKDLRKAWNGATDSDILKDMLWEYHYERVTPDIGATEYLKGLTNARYAAAFCSIPA